MGDSRIEDLIRDYEAARAAWVRAASPGDVGPEWDAFLVAYLLLADALIHHRQAYTLGRWTYGAERGARTGHPVLGRRPRAAHPTKFDHTLNPERKRSKDAP